jgi:Ca2+-binding RTX toxin-like protein
MRQHDEIGDALVVHRQGSSDARGYRAYTTDVYVNLQTRTATDIASFRGIRNLTGGGGRNVLVGDGTQESLTGGTGRNLLISGGGSGQLIGGGAGDILIGGVTAYDQDPDSLWAILDYWSESADDYPTRVENLRLGNGVPQLDTGVSVFGGGAANTLTGNGDETQGVLNLFYLTQAGTITDQQPSEVAVVLDAGAAPGAGVGGPFRSRPADPAVPVGDDLSGRPGPADLEAGPGSVTGTAGVLLHGARQPGSAEDVLIQDLAWCDGWQPFPGLDAGIR